MQLHFCKAACLLCSHKGDVENGNKERREKRDDAKTTAVNSDSRTDGTLQCSQAWPLDQG